MAQTTLREVPALWRSRTPFRGNSISATTDRPATLGQLPADWQTTYRYQEMRDEIVYTVLSYNTPIAWVLRDGTEVKPPVKYSVTTSKHQGRLY